MMPPGTGGCVGLEAQAENALLPPVPWGHGIFHSATQGAEPGCRTAEHPSRSTLVRKHLRLDCRSEAFLSGDAKKALGGTVTSGKLAGAVFPHTTFSPPPCLCRDCWELLEPLTRGDYVGERGCLHAISPRHFIMRSQNS